MPNQPSRSTKILASPLPFRTRCDSRCVQDAERPFIWSHNTSVYVNNLEILQFDPRLGLAGRYGELSRFDTMPSRPIMHARSNIILPSPLKCSLQRMPGFALERAYLFR